MRRLLFLILLLPPIAAHAQSTAAQSEIGYLTYTQSSTCANPPCWVGYGSTVPVNASVTASISGFTAASVGTPISVTTGGVTGTLPAGAEVVASNAGSTNDAYCALGASTTTAWQDIPPKSWFAFTVGASTQLTCITSTGATTVNMVGGAGLPTGSGGGGGGGGGGGTVTIGAPLGAAAPASGVSVTLDTTNGGYLSTLAGGVASGIYQYNLKQVNGVTVLTGAGATGTGAQRETVSQDTTTIAGSAPGTAGAASGNVVTVQGVASMTPVQVSQATAASLNATVVGTGTFAVQAALNATPSLANGNGVVQTQGGSVLSVTNPSFTEITDGTNGAAAIKAASTAAVAADKAIVVAISPNNAPVLPTGAATATNQTNVIGSVAGGTAAADSELAGGVYVSSAPTLTTGQQASLQLNVSGYLNTAVPSGANITEGTTADSAYAGTGNCTVIACLKGLYLAPGQTTMSGSTPVAIASNQSALTVAQATAANLNAAVVGLGTAGSPSGGVLTTQPPVAGQVAVSTAPTTAANTAQVVDLRPDSPGIITLGPAAVANSVPFTFSSQYPTNATTTTPTPETASATGTTGATTATLAAASGKTTYICGFTITADATALTTGTATVTGVITGTLSYLQSVLAATNGVAVLTDHFNPCVPASTTNTTISVVSIAAGTGGNTAVVATGYQL